MANDETAPEGNIPGSPNNSWTCDPRAILVVLALVSVVGVLAVYLFVNLAGPVAWKGLLVFISLFLFLSFLYLFTGAIGKLKMTGMVVFCYGFTAFAIVASVLPFAVFDSKWPNLDKAFRQTPIGVMKGCSVAPQSGSIPDEIKCANSANGNYQWVINIGGSTASTGGDKPPKTEQNPNNGGDKGVPPEGSGKQQVSHANIHGGIVVPLYVIVLALIGGAVSMTRRVPEYQRQVWLHYWCDDPDGRPASVQPPAAPEAAVGKAPAAAAGQQPDKAPAAAAGQQPGQAPAATAGRQSDKGVEVISGPAAREYLVFQLMQVVSAPLIAIAAYYAFSPATPIASVAVGFASGFTSETILLGIRGLAEALTPSAKPKQPSE